MINKNFYPTPKILIEKMLSGVKLDNIKTILEPSAGKGDIVDFIKNKNYYGYRSPEVDCIELDDNLKALLKGKGHRVIHNDFLTFNTFKRYDLIIMNPPFDNGDKHLLKAIELQKNGGAIICLLNAETLKNPYSNTRKDLVKKLQGLNADIEYIENGFKNAERKTNVETALIKIIIEECDKKSLIFENLKQEEVFKTYDEYGKEISKHTDDNFIDMIVEKYETEIKFGIKVIDEYYLMNKYCHDENCLFLRTGTDRQYDQDTKQDVINNFVEKVRKKYWKELFQSDKFMEKLTNDLTYKYMDKINELKDYDFSIFNILEIREQLQKEVVGGIEDAILKIFDEFSCQYSWNKEFSTNIHYYNGWATNKSWKINKKVIIPLNAYDVYSKSFSPCYNTRSKINDIVLVFNYLNYNKANKINVGDILNKAREEEQTSKVDFGYFNCTFYKKGTTHIEFQDLELLEKFNIFGSQKKNWLPPNYGKKSYDEFNKQEQDVIKEFNKEIKYNEIFENQKKYLINTTLLLGN